jgi:TolB-like protein/Tfp pilus assembly protein PilF
MDPPAAPPVASLTPSDAAEMRAALDRVLASPGFAAAARRSLLLRHIVDRTLAGQGERITEYGIGLDVFARPPSFDPRLDSIVRTETSRLRQKLREYYAGPGSEERFVIEVPQRSYAAVIRKRQIPAPAEPPPPALRPRRFAWTWLVLVLAAMAGGAFALHNAWNRPRLTWVVVLPFLDYSPGQDAAYLADGITEELTNQLAQQRDLRVVARTSATAIKNKGLDIREIGRRLNAGAALEGSLVKDGATVRITAQLNRTSDGYHLWSRSFEAPYRELAGVQAQIAQSVEAVLLKREVPPPQAIPNPEAHDLYLQAAYQLARQTPDALDKALALFQAAVGKDPSYVDAYRGIARVEIGRVHYTSEAPLPAYQRARAALEKALAIDPNNAESLGALASIDYLNLFDWARAEPEFRLAIERGAQAGTRSSYGWSLATRGRFAEARRQLEFAQDLDPLAAGPRFNLAMSYLLARQFEPAQREFRRAIADGVSPLDSQFMLGVIAYYERDCAPAAAQFDSLQGRLPAPLENFGLALAAACGGRIAEARQHIAKAQAAADQAFVSPYQLAMAEAALGDKEAALAALERSADAREGQILYLKFEPAFDGIRADPRYRAIEKRVGLE